jgi:hypothetical protein
MKAQYDQLVLSSFRTWLDHVILDKGEAFSNQTLQMYETATDEQYPTQDTYSASIYQWVYDSSIPGASIPAAVDEVAGGTISRGTDGLHIDFENGRAIFTGSHAGITDMTIDVSVKEINTYITTSSDQQLVHELKFGEEPDLRPVNGPLLPNQIVSPAVFIRLIKRDNDPACIGGMDWTKLLIRCVCFGSEWQLTSLGSILGDKKHCSLPILAASDLPIDEYGDIKGGSFDYDALIAASYTSSDKLAFIDQVSYSTYENDSLSKNHPKIRVGFADFTITKGRFPRT